MRRKEEKAIINKTRHKRKGPAKPREIAAQIYEDTVNKEGHLLRQYDPHFLDRSKPFDTFDIPEKGKAEALHTLFIKHGVAFRVGNKILAQMEVRVPAQVALIIFLSESGVRGLTRVPHEDNECRRVYVEYADFVYKRNRKILGMIEDRTSDQDMQEKIYEELLPRLIRNK